MESTRLAIGEGHGIGESILRFKAKLFIYNGLG